MSIRYERASGQYALSYNRAVDEVARERKYLAATSGFSPESSIGLVKRVEEHNLAQYFAIDGEKVVGWCDIFAGYHEGLTHAGTLGMGVLKDYRGQGIGRALIRMTIKHAKEICGLEKVELEVFKSNTAAIALYESEGFAKEGEKINSRKLDGKYDNLVVMGRMI